MVVKALHTITEKDVDEIVDFIRGVVKRTGCKGIVMGVSGGLDSAVTAKLCADAIGPDNVLGIFMPSVLTPREDRDHTEEMSRSWNIGYEVVNVQPAIEAFTKTLASDVRAPLERGNISARCRMIVLYNRAKKLNYLVAGTSNRSEYMMGYFTKFGDGAYDIGPIIDLYKTQVWQVAEIIGVPKKVIEKVPTAGLWEGQTDEEEMGITYRHLDIILNGMSFGLSDEQIAKDAAIDISKVSEIRCTVSKMGHKRMQAYRPDICFNDP
ncbi:putative NH(3)-dependent NAD(+) synthetase [Candidatus Methanoplasma termitum]|uniref:NH(3)-dependent NAD(+) synthetase n=1 Tax=Candidatus Methanoplasma termitum TaxID=1577791 RepID=A0A0A7LBZ8_9ARCH|nr:NAD+ synthase [Candidatus Methanoplasma termitum]AIZ56680.1 putative NH(3)-dependent NAD(+) synthetase [Candidatus Methanoplasma termitum]MCL2333324.1 NAD+ synthase [Candidatus Methanoplasma sp.]